MHEANFNKLFDLLESSDPIKQDWLAKLIVGVIVADGRIDDKERPFLGNEKYPLFRKPEIQALLENMELPHLEMVEFPPDTITYIMKCALDICAADGEIHEKELEFLKKAGTSLHMSEKEIDDLFWKQ